MAKTWVRLPVPHDTPTYVALTTRILKFLDITTTIHEFSITSTNGADIVYLRNLFHCAMLFEYILHTPTGTMTSRASSESL